MKKNLIIIAFFALFSLSCSEDGSGGGSGKKHFWSVNFSTNTPYILEAKLLAQNNRCEVWAETGSGVSASTAQNIANHYRDYIYKSMMSVFGWKDNHEGYNVMQWADIFGDGNGKLTILLLDIKDGYIKNDESGYVAGYFSPHDLLLEPESNRCDIIYMDINPAKADSTEFYETLAHEMQHLMNFITTLLFRSKIVNKKITEFYIMDTWIDEGLSESAAWVYSQRHNNGRLEWYNESKLISEGNNFFVWGNREGNGAGKHPGAVLDDYATVYLFFQWLRIQKGDTSIYYDIHVSHKSGYEAVLDAVHNMGYTNWDSLLGTWLAANYIRSGTGEYGYGNDKTLNDIARHYAPENRNNIELFPGEGVYSITNTAPDTNIANHGSNVDYKFILNNAVSGSYGQGSTLLTYNKNVSIKDSAEKGYITGIAPAAPSANVSSRSLQSSSGPYKISGGDLLRQRGIEQNINPSFLSAPDNNSERPRALTEKVLPFTKDEITRYTGD